MKEDNLTHVVRARVTEADFLLLLTLGRGDLSKGIRAAVSALDESKVREVQKLSENIAADAARLRELCGR